MGRQGRCKKCINLLYYQPNKQKYLEKVRERRSTEEGKRREREWATQQRNKFPLVRMVYNAKTRATKKGLPFDITADDLVMPKYCPVLGLELSRGITRKDESPSIDRIDCGKGYVKGNVRVISWRANRLKNDATLEELKAIINYMEKA